MRLREIRARITEHGTVIDTQRFDPALLAKGEPDEETQLDQFRNREILIEFLP
jgi:hypothetical protein